LFDIDAFVFRITCGVVIIIDVDSTRNIPNIEEEI
jgi:hypothetical protein